jgi:hypothetical protein
VVGSGPCKPISRRKKSDGNVFFCGQVALMADPFFFR